MKAALVALLAISLVVTGCSTTRITLPGATSDGVRMEIHAGDRAKILLKTGETRILRISAVDDQTLTGKEGRGAKAASVQIALADVQSIEIRRTSVLRTALLAVGVVVGLAVVLAGVVLISCSSGNASCGD